MFIQQHLHACFDCLVEHCHHQCLIYICFAFSRLLSLLFLRGPFCILMYLWYFFSHYLFLFPVFFWGLLTLRSLRLTEQNRNIFVLSKTACSYRMLNFCILSEVTDLIYSPINGILREFFIVLPRILLQRLFNHLLMTFFRKISHSIAFICSLSILVCVIHYRFCIWQ